MGSKKRFAAGMGFYKLFWIFFIGCFLGVVIEMIFCFVTRGGLIQSRSGLLYGPFNPVYGFGAVVLSVTLKPLAGKRDLLVFLVSMIEGSAFEYLCSFVQQQLFGTISWDYSHIPFNIGGRTCLLYGFFWGILGLLWVKDIFPKLSLFIEKIPRALGMVMTWILVVFMTANMLISAAAVLRWCQRDEGIPAKNQIENYLDQHYPNERMREVYPNMKL